MENVNTREIPRRKNGQFTKFRKKPSGVVLYHLRRKEALENGDCEQEKVTEEHGSNVEDSSEEDVPDITYPKERPKRQSALNLSQKMIPWWKKVGTLRQEMLKQKMKKRKKKKTLNKCVKRRPKKNRKAMVQTQASFESQESMEEEQSINFMNKSDVYVDKGKGMTVQTFRESVNNNPTTHCGVKEEKESIFNNSESNQAEQSSVYHMYVPFDKITSIAGQSVQDFVKSKSVTNCGPTIEPPLFKNVDSNQEGKRELTAYVSDIPIKVEPFQEYATNNPMGNYGAATAQQACDESVGSNQVEKCKAADCGSYVGDCGLTGEPQTFTESVENNVGDKCEAAKCHSEVDCNTPGYHRSVTVDKNKCVRLKKLVLYHNKDAIPNLSNVDLGTKYFKDSWTDVDLPVSTPNGLSVNVEDFTQEDDTRVKHVPSTSNDQRIIPIPMSNTQSVNVEDFTQEVDRRVKHVPSTSNDQRIIPIPLSNTHSVNVEHITEEDDRTVQNFLSNSHDQTTVLCSNITGCIKQEQCVQNVEMVLEYPTTRQCLLSVGKLKTKREHLSQTMDRYDNFSKTLTGEKQTIFENVKIKQEHLSDNETDTNLPSFSAMESLTFQKEGDGLQNDSSANMETSKESPFPVGIVQTMNFQPDAFIHTEYDACVKTTCTDVTSSEKSTNNDNFNLLPENIKIKQEPCIENENTVVFHTADCQREGDNSVKCKIEMMEYSNEPKMAKYRDLDMM